MNRINKNLLEYNNSNEWLMFRHLNGIKNKIKKYFYHKNKWIINNMENKKKIENKNKNLIIMNINQKVILNKKKIIKLKFHKKNLKNKN